MGKVQSATYKSQLRKKSRLMKNLATLLLASMIALPAHAQELHQPCKSNEDVYALNMLVFIKDRVGADDFATAHFITECLSENYSDYDPILKASVEAYKKLSMNMNIADDACLESYLGQIGLIDLYADRFPREPKADRLTKPEN